jgi:hypothetical protein
MSKNAEAYVAALAKVLTRGATALDYQHMTDAWQRPNEAESYEAQKLAEARGLIAKGTARGSSKMAERMKITRRLRRGLEGKVVT